MDVMYASTYDVLGRSLSFGLFSGDAALARRPPPPGFPPLPVPALADPVYATPVPTLRVFMERPPSRVDADVEPTKIEAPVPSLFPARGAPISDGVTSKTSKDCVSSYNYDADIDASLRAMEKDAKERPSPNYLKTKRPDWMTPTTRADLVLWMDKFAHHFNLFPGTFHRAVSFVDRVLSVSCLNCYSEYSLCLLGAAAFFVAAKYEETRSARRLAADDIVWYGQFDSRQELLNTESAMLRELDYRLSGPTAYTFVERFTMHSHSDVGEHGRRVRYVAHTLALQSLLNYGCLVFLPSTVAASAIFLARSMLNLPPWSVELQELTGYSIQDLLGCLSIMDP